MQLAPRYDATPLISLDDDPSALRDALVGQQRRFVDALGSLSEADWNEPSRCAGWSARDVVVHLESATGFWVLSLAEGMSGRPSRFLADFDPVTTPARMVAESEFDGPTALERFEVAATSLAAAVADLDASDWDTLVEAPPGHMTASAMAHHALWDSWVHERDVLAPLGRDVAVVADEVLASLRYVAALSPAIGLLTDAHSAGSLLVEATDPDLTFRVIVGDGQVRVVDATTATGSTGGTGSTAADAHLEGDAVVLLDALSRRAEMPAGAVAATDGSSWLLDGLAAAFDQT